MMPAPRAKLATQVDPEALDEVRKIAAREEVLTALGESLAEYEALYRELAR